MFFNSFTTTLSYFPLLFKEQLLVATSDLHSFYKSRLFMAFSVYPREQSLLINGQELVSTTLLHDFCLTDIFFQLTVLGWRAT